MTTTPSFDLLMKALKDSSLREKGIDYSSIDEFVSMAISEVKNLEEKVKRFENASNGIGMLSELDGIEEQVVLVVGLHDKIASYEKEMNCGHKARYVFEEGTTKWCMGCVLEEANRLATENRNKLNQIQRISISYGEGHENSDPLSDMLVIAEISK